MDFAFSKYSGAGNDFILIDNRSGRFPPQPQCISKICNRRTGVGADGVILFEDSKSAHARMRIFNCDGTEAEMCGNGLRAFVKYLGELGISRDSFQIETKAHPDGHWCRLEQDKVAIKMGTPKIFHWNLELEKGKTLSFLDTGVPHAVTMVDDIESLDIFSAGSWIRHHPFFAPRGTNATFVTLRSDQRLTIRTFERGVEAETLACGTGAVAAAVCMAKKFGLPSPIEVKVRSGDLLKIRFKKDFDDLELIGPAIKTFEGRFSLNG